MKSALSSYMHPQCSQSWFHVLSPISSKSRSARSLLRAHDSSLLSMFSTSLTTPVGQISPLFIKRGNMNFHCTTAAFTVSRNRMASWSLAHSPRRLGLICDFCSSARTFALGLPPHSTSRGCTYRRLVVIIALLRTMPVSHRGLAPHKFMPMPGVPKNSRGLRPRRSPCIWLYGLPPLSSTGF